MQSNKMNCIAEGKNFLIFTVGVHSMTCIGTFSCFNNPFCLIERWPFVLTLLPFRLSELLFFQKQKLSVFMQQSSYLINRLPGLAYSVSTWLTSVFDIRVYECQKSGLVGARLRSYNRSRRVCLRERRRLIINDGNPSPQNKLIRTSK